MYVAYNVACTLFSAEWFVALQTGGLGSMVVLLSSVDSTTRKLTARKEKQRTRPPRLFEPGLPRLCLLQDRMVVRLRSSLTPCFSPTPLWYHFTRRRHTPPSSLTSVAHTPLPYIISFPGLLFASAAGLLNPTPP